MQAAKFGFSGPLSLSEAGANDLLGNLLRAKESAWANTHGDHARSSPARDGIIIIAPAAAALTTDAVGDRNR